MSRSGYSDDLDWNILNLYRGAVDRAIAGKRGQAFLRDLVTALETMPEKKLIADSLITFNGEVCALGCLGKARGLNMRHLDTSDNDVIGKTFGIARSLAAEVMFVNDEIKPEETDEQRYARVLAWAKEQIKP